MTLRQLLDVVLLVAGISAPIGLLVVNGAAFVMNHLAEFRFSIGVAAVLSSLALSGLTAHTVLGRVAAYVPDLYARFRQWMIGAAVVAVIAWSLLGGWGAYQSMSDARRLPSVYVVLTALWLLALPFAMSFISRRLRRASEAQGPPSGEAVESLRSLQSEVPGTRRDQTDRTGPEQADDQQGVESRATRPGR